MIVGRRVKSEKLSQCQIALADEMKRDTVTPIPYWMCRVDMIDLHSEMRIKDLAFANQTVTTGRSGVASSFTLKLSQRGKRIFGVFQKSAQRSI